jgi:uncharacterized membrane protein YvbJ
MLCPKCETINSDEDELCTNCGEKLVKASEETSQSEPVVHQRITGIDLKPSASKKTGVSNGLYIGVMIATVILPIIGIIMGFTYMRKDHPSAKKAGKNWMIVGAVMILFNIILVSVI